MTAPNLETLRSELTSRGRDILDFVWTHAKSRNLSEWPLVRVTNIRFGVTSSDQVLSLFPSGAILIDSTRFDARYVLGFLGLLLASNGPRCEELLVEYLGYLRRRAAEDPSFSIVKSREVETSLALQPDDVALLGQGIHLGRFYGTRASGGGPVWACDVPHNLDALMGERDLHEYVQAQALRDLQRSSGPSGKSQALPATTPATRPELVSRVTESNAKVDTRRSTRTVGGWTLGAELGTGGQGSVFRASRAGENASDGVFAIKLLSKSSSEKARKRFERELEALKKIEHDAIVRVVDTSGPDAPQPYYVMPFDPKSRSLRQILASSRKGSRFRHEPVACLEFIGKCSSALAAVHDAKVIHRDLSLDNILVTPSGDPVIIDFGCCLPHDAEPLTSFGEGVGTRHFMAPECEAGADDQVTIQSDLYSLGKILWCLFTGLRPFAREEAGFKTEALAELLSCHSAAGFILEIMLRTVRRDPSHRLATANALAVEARDYVTRIRAGEAHLSHAAKRCPACYGTNVSVTRERIEKPLGLDTHVFLAANNPALRVKFCFGCGHMSYQDSRPLDEFESRLKAAAGQLT